MIHSNDVLVLKLNTVEGMAKSLFSTITIENILKCVRISKVMSGRKNGEDTN